MSRQAGRAPCRVRVVRHSWWRESFRRALEADMRFDLPVTKLAPGPYLLSVEASAGRVSAKREVRFALRSP
jgi:hypothetical protein